MWPAAPKRRAVLTPLRRLPSDLPEPFSVPVPAKRPAGDPIGRYDLGWMWQELGVEALRQ